MPESADISRPVEGHHEDLVTAPDEGRSRAVLRASLGRRTQAALWALRAFAVLVTFMVVYAFVAQLHP